MLPAERARARPDHVIEALTEADLDALMEIERLSFEPAWSRQVFLDELGRPSAHVDVLRCRPGRRVAAFCNYWEVADELHILKIATHPDERRRGWGACLLETMIAFARGRGCRLVTLEVRRSNDEAQRLYRRFGFKSVGLRPGYYAGDGEDAVIMTLLLNETSGSSEATGREVGP